MKATNILKSTLDFINRNNTTILTAVACVSATSAVTMTIATSMKITREAVKVEARTGKEYTPTEIIIANWKDFILPVTMLGVSIFSIIQLNRIHSKQTAAVASLYALTDASYKDLQESIKETLSKKEVEKIEEKVNQKATDRVEYKEEEVIDTGFGPALCLDLNSGRYFYSSINELEKIENQINKRLLSESHIALNEIYSELNLEPVNVGWDLGLRGNGDDVLEFKFGSSITEQDKPCLTVGFDVSPIKTY